MWFTVHERNIMNTLHSKIKYGISTVAYKHSKARSSNDTSTVVYVYMNTWKSKIKHNKSTVVYISIYMNTKQYE